MITVMFWACLVSSGACEQKIVQDFGGPMGCAGPASQSAAAKWLDEHPAYTLKVSADFPIVCVVGRSAAL